jgi:hypothetical protein
LEVGQWTMSSSYFSAGGPMHLTRLDLAETAAEDGGRLLQLVEEQASRCIDGSCRLGRGEVALLDAKMITAPRRDATEVAKVDMDDGRPCQRSSRPAADVAALTSSSQSETGGESGWHALAFC